MLNIKLNGKYSFGQPALIDNSDIEIVSKYKWHVGKNGYVSSQYRSRGKRIHITLHRLICGFPDGKDIDHINHNKLDNRKSNLRICSRGLNHANRLKIKGTSSIYKGVSYNVRQREWRVSIKKNGIVAYRGSFKNELEAAIEYDKRAKNIFGEYALLNFPQTV